ncbi:MAG: glycosyltransferase [Elusimicrobia bacterium]|nr:glycosyltransferase [Candidatus Liberimonas magnetica]
MNNKIKIIHIITRIDVGGTADDITTIFNKLDKNKYEQILIYGPGQVDLGDTVRNYRIPELKRELSLMDDFVSFWKIYNIINDEKPAILHTHSSKSGFLGRWAAWLFNLLATFRIQHSKIKIVHTPHGHVFYGYEFGRLKTRLFILLECLTSPITDRFIALTEGEKNESVKFCRVNPKKWEVINSGVGLDDALIEQSCMKIQEKRKELGIGSNILVIGTVARLVPVKGIMYLIEAVPLILKSYKNSLKFLIVGDGLQKDAIEKRIKELNLEENIILTGMRNDIYELMSAMDIYVQPSLNEGMGITLIQAQAVGLPIVASRVQGIPNAIKENETGMLIPPKDPAALSKAVLKLIENVDLRKNMSARAKIWVCETIDGCRRFSPERMIKMHEKLYEEMIQEV